MNRLLLDRADKAMDESRRLLAIFIVTLEGVQMRRRELHWESQLQAFRERLALLPMGPV